ADGARARRGGQTQPSREGSREAQYVAGRIRARKLPALVVADVVARLSLSRPKLSDRDRRRQRARRRRGAQIVRQGGARDRRRALAHSALRRRGHGAVDSAANGRRRSVADEAIDQWLKILAARRTKSPPSRNSHVPHVAASRSGIRRSRK